MFQKRPSLPQLESTLALLKGVVEYLMEFLAEVKLDEQETERRRRDRNVVCILLAYALYKLLSSISESPTSPLRQNLLIILTKPKSLLGAS